jgi:hypothetical protein
MKLDVLFAVHFIAKVCKLVTLMTINNCFAKCGFPVDHVHSSGDNALEVTEDEEKDWHSLQILECSLQTT